MQINLLMHAVKHRRSWLLPKQSLNFLLHQRMYCIISSMLSRSLFFFFTVGLSLPNKSFSDAVLICHRDTFLRLAGLTCGNPGELPWPGLRDKILMALDTWGMCHHFVDHLHCPRSSSRFPSQVSVTFCLPQKVQRGVGLIQGEHEVQIQLYAQQNLPVHLS